MCVYLDSFEIRNYNLILMVKIKSANINNKVVKQSQCVYSI